MALVTTMGVVPAILLVLAAFDSDSKGCLLRPEVVTLGDEQGGWPESLKYCQDQGYSLVSLNTEEFLLQVANKLRESGTQIQGQTQGQVWIGLRRSSLTGQWYWLSKAAVSFTHWAQAVQGQCAMMTLDPQGNYTWSDQSCCEALPAVCYREPLHVPLQ